MSCTQHHTEHATRADGVYGRAFDWDDQHDYWERCEEMSQPILEPEPDRVEKAFDRLEGLLGDLRSVTGDENLLKTDCDELRHRVEEALKILDREARRHHPQSLVGQLIQQIGCHLTGRKGRWRPGDR
jgi:hypothetical protein